MTNRILLNEVNRLARAMSQYERLDFVSVSLPKPRPRRDRASLSVRPCIAPINILLILPPTVQHSNPNLDSPHHGLAQASRA